MLAAILVHLHKWSALVPSHLGLYNDLEQTVIRLAVNGSV